MCRGHQGKTSDSGAYEKLSFLIDGGNAKNNCNLIGGREKEKDKESLNETRGENMETRVLQCGDTKLRTAWTKHSKWFKQRQIWRRNLSSCILISLKVPYDVNFPLTMFSKNNMCLLPANELKL